MNCILQNIPFGVTFFREGYFFDKCVHDLDFTLKIFPA